MDEIVPMYGLTYRQMAQRMVEGYERALAEYNHQNPALDVAREWLRLTEAGEATPDEVDALVAAVSDETRGFGSMWSSLGGYARHWADSLRIARAMIRYHEEHPAECRNGKSGDMAREWLRLIQAERLPPDQRQAFRALARQGDCYDAVSTEWRKYVSIW